MPSNRSAGSSSATTARPTGRSQLILLRELGDPVIAGKARIAWDGLSRACHHHSYELQPTVGEVRGLVMAVKEIVEQGK